MKKKTFIHFVNVETDPRLWYSENNWLSHMLCFFWNGKFLQCGAKLFSKTQRNDFFGVFFIIHWDKFGFLNWKNKHTWKKSTVWTVVSNYCWILLGARVNRPPWLHQLAVLSTGWAVFFICLFTPHSSTFYCSQVFCLLSFDPFFLGQFFPNPDPPYHPPT